MLAIAAAHKTPADIGVTPAHWRAGLEAVRWPGRLELVGRQPYVVLDGAHNDDSFGRLGQALDRHFPHRRLHLVFGASRDKDIEGMLAAIQRPGLALYGCRSQHGRSAELAAIAQAPSHWVWNRTYSTRGRGSLGGASGRRMRGLRCVAGSLLW